MDSLSRLPNLGPKSAKWLEDAGIASRADLQELGAVFAYKIVKHRHPQVTLNLLYALHGALTGTHWNGLSPDVKDRLRREVEEPLNPVSSSGKPRL